MADGDAVDLVEGNKSATDTEETQEQKVERLEAENKNLKDGNSKLGRDFKSFKEQMEADVSTQMETVMDKVNQLGTGKQEVESNDYGLEDEDEDKKLRRISREEARKDREEASDNLLKAKEKYVKDYAKKIQDMGRNEENAEVYEAITNEMKDMPGYSNDGTTDALTNYNKGKLKVYEAMLNKTKGDTAFRGQDTGGTGVGGASGTKKAGEVETEPLDEHAKLYLSRRGKTNDKEFIKRALGRKTPTGGKVSL